jgi:hypothetical protein
MEPMNARAWCVVASQGRKSAIPVERLRKMLQGEKLLGNCHCGGMMPGAAGPDKFLVMENMYMVNALHDLH